MRRGRILPCSAPLQPKQETWPIDYSLIHGHETLVNLRKVGDLVEDVVECLRREHAGDRLRLHPRLCLVEFETRYGLYFPANA